MLQLLNTLVDICLLRRGPQHLPASPALTTLTLLLYGVLVAMVARLFADDARPAAWAAFSLALLVGAVFVLLRLRGLHSRFLQTLSALAGCGALYLCVYVPLTAAVNVQAGADGSIVPLLLLLWFGVFLWGFIIEGHIYRLALNLSLPAGVLVSALFYALATTLHHHFFEGGA